jgi:hypothetical protein
MTATIATHAEAEHTRAMDTAAALEDSAPIIIYRSVNRQGQTFALEPLSKMRLREHLGEDVHLHPRVFIAHETTADYERVRRDLAAQVIQLLAGVSEERLQEFGGVEFRDPATETELQLSR